MLTILISKLLRLKKNRTFIAKKSNTFEEEKNVAEKAPVDEVKMDDLTNIESKSEKKLRKKSSFILVISDFYYIDSAYNLKKTLGQANALKINYSTRKGTY